MSMLDEKTANEVKKVLSAMIKPVTLKLFTQPFECTFCKQTHELLDEVVGLNDKLKLEVYEFDQDTEEVKKNSIDKIPAIAIIGDEDFGIRFYGIPSGYEFSSLLNSILMVSTGVVKLTNETKAFLDNLAKPVHIQVFVTPTCPYCPPAVILAHSMAFYSKMVSSDMVEVSEFPHIANKYSVQGVPRSVINEKWFMEGAAPENMIIEKIKESL